MEASKKASNPDKNPSDKSSEIPPKTKGDSGVNVPPNQQNPHDNQSNGGEKPPRSKYINKWFDPLVVVTVILVTVTGFLAYYTYKLFNDASTANERNKEAIQAAKESAKAATNAV